MANKVKIKLKRGKAKIKLKSGDNALPLGSEQLQQLLGAVLASAVSIPPRPVVSGLLTGPRED